MAKKNIKRGYNFSPELLDEWEKFHLPSKDYSPSAAAAFLLYMVVEPALREALRKLACEKDIKKARLEARKLLRQTIIDAYLTGFVGMFSEEDRAILLGGSMPSEKKLPAKKSLQDALQMIKEMVQVEKQQPGTIYRVLSPDEQKTVDDFIRAVGPDQQKQRKKAKKA